MVEHGAALAERAARGIPGIAARARARGAADVQHARPRHAEGAARRSRRAARACLPRHARPRRHAGRRRLLGAGDGHGAAQPGLS